jgi:hypothetical protein
LLPTHTNEYLPNAEKERDKELALEQPYQNLFALIIFIRKATKSIMAVK